MKVTTGSGFTTHHNFELHHVSWLYDELAGGESIVGLVLFFVRPVEVEGWIATEPCCPYCIGVKTPVFFMGRAFVIKSVHQLAWIDFCSTNQNVVQGPLRTLHPGNHEPIADHKRLPPAKSSGVGEGPLREEDVVVPHRNVFLEIHLMKQSPSDSSILRVVQQHALLPADRPMARRHVVLTADASPVLQEFGTSEV